jgi:DNA-binding transcriptional ArsR family regulator
MLEEQMVESAVKSAVTTSVDGCGVRLVDPGKVAQVAQTMPQQGEVVDLADVFSLLGEPGRLRLLVALLEAGELCVCDLAAVSGMSESAVSHALRLLRARRVVSVNRRGRMAFYRLDDAHVRMLLDLGLTHTAHTTVIHPEREGGR